jgi:Na+/melibiose symporter-like transporter
MWLYLARYRRRVMPFVLFGLIMLAIQAYVFFGPPPASGNAAAMTALAAYAIFAAVIRLLERRSHDVDAPA